jgi:hypothetical protein
MVIIHDVVQGDSEWHKLHEGRWTGSTAIKLLQGKPLPKWVVSVDNKYTSRGKFLEPIALREYRLSIGAPQTRTKIGFITNSKYPNAGFSPDDILDKILLEVKCLNGERHEALTEKIPLEYLVQMHFGMFICELPKARLIGYNPDSPNELIVREVKRDKQIIANIRDKLSAYG